MEIERKKPDWQNHLEDKRWKYTAIAEKQETWADWWKSECRNLNLNHCRMENFGFTVWCVGEFEEEWPGWDFKHFVDAISLI